MGPDGLRKEDHLVQRRVQLVILLQLREPEHRDQLLTGSAVSGGAQQVGPCRRTS